MKLNMFKTVATGAVIAALALGATSANAATASATARAKILREVTVTNTSDLQFGTIVTGASASTVAIGSTGTRICGTGLICSGTTTAANFLVGGTTGQVVTISSDASVTLASGTHSMTAVLTPSAVSATLVANAATFSVGGLLTVGASQADGDYAGTFNVTVNY